MRTQRIKVATTTTSTATTTTIKIGQLACASNLAAALSPTICGGAAQCFLLASLTSKMQQLQQQLQQRPRGKLTQHKEERARERGEAERRLVVPQNQTKCVTTSVVAVAELCLQLQLHLQLHLRLRLSLAATTSLRSLHNFSSFHFLLLLLQLQLLLLLLLLPLLIRQQFDAANAISKCHVG